MPEDYYALLGVEPDASEEAILRAYRERAAEHHPDVSDDPDAEETFRRLNRAKSVLTDADRRRRYDRLGHERFVAEADDAAGEPDGAPADRRGEPSRATSGGSVGGLGPLLGALFGAPAWGSGVGRRPPVDVDLEDAVRRARDGRRRRPGAARRAANDDDSRPCPKCDG
ncbi:MAG: J domain-containing protein, partial [Halobacteriales archaeon]